MNTGASADFSVLASTNLTDLVLLTNGLSLRYQIADPDTAKFPYRFYRLRGF